MTSKLVGFTAAATAAAVVVISRIAGRRPGNSPIPDWTASGSAQPSHDVMFRYMTTFILPVWTAAGLTDYLCHRVSDIERTSGTRESVLHLLMLAEGAPMALGGLFFEMNAGALALLTAAAAVHEATVVWDFKYTSDKRPTRPIEQHAHSFLESVPIALLAFAVATHWEQFAGLFGRGGQSAEFRLKLRKPPLSAKGLTGLILAMVGLVVIPHCEELLRCRVAERQGARGSAIPPAFPRIMRSLAA